MKQIIFLLLLFQISSVSAQFDFQNDKNFQFSHTEYLCNSSEIGLDTLLNENEYEVRIWVTKNGIRNKNLFRLYKPLNDSLIHAKMYKMRIREDFDCVGLIMEPIIPDSYLDSIDLQIVFNNLKNIKRGKPEFCVGIHRKNTIKFLMKEKIITQKNTDLNDLDDSILLNLPSEFYAECNKNLFNYFAQKDLVINYTVELLKPDKRRGYVFRSPLKYPKKIIENNEDLERFTLH